MLKTMKTASGASPEAVRIQQLLISPTPQLTTRSPSQDLPQHSDCARIVALADPEDRLAADGGVAVRARDLEQWIDPLSATHLRQREDRVAARVVAVVRAIDLGDVLAVAHHLRRGE